MNSTNLTKSSEEQSAFKPDVLNIAIGAAAALVVAYLLKKKKSKPIWKDKNILPIKPPPIIIKSGSFIIDSVEGFKDAGNINGNSKRKKVNRYKGKFGVIKRVIVNQVNERFVNDSNPARPFGYDYSNSNGVIIKLWFQKLLVEDPERWDSDDVNGEPDVVSRLSTPVGSELPTLELELPDDLTKSNGNKHHKRKNKDKLDIKKDTSGTDRYFRIGRIQILDSNGSLIKQFLSLDGDEYYISLWDEN